MSISLPVIRNAIAIVWALFLPVASFWVGIIIGSLLAAHWISIIIILYNLSIPSCLITFGMPAGG